MDGILAFHFGVGGLDMQRCGRGGGVGVGVGSMHVHCTQPAYVPCAMCRMNQTGFCYDRLSKYPETDWEWDL